MTSRNTVKALSVVVALAITGLMVTGRGDSGGLARAAAAAQAVDMAITDSPYFESGLFANRTVAPEGEQLTITVRADVEGTLGRAVAASVVVRGRDGGVIEEWDVALELGDGKAEGTIKWTPPRNGMYRVEATIDPRNEIAEENEDNNVATLDLPVVIPGRLPDFPWFHERSHLRLANIWAGVTSQEHLERWRERGVMPLAWKYGTLGATGDPTEADYFNRNTHTEEDYFNYWSNIGDYPGIAIDEFGYRPTSELVAYNEFALRALRRVKEANPEMYVFVWHSGALYPEQAALYRDAVDLLVLESYCFWYAPQGLQTDNAYAFLDMKMLPARQVDLIMAHGTPGAKCITSVDLNPSPESFHRGEMEQIVRHLRRQWPEMRGFGIFGVRAAADAADEQFVDQLCFEYFIQPVVTLMPHSLWVTREEDGQLTLTLAISNIGGMDSGPVRVALFDEGRRLGTFGVDAVPAGDSRVTNRAFVRHPWTPTADLHHLTAQIESAAGAQVLDAEVECEYFVGSS